MLSGGIGIAPLRSMIRYCTDLGIKSSIVLLYSNSLQDGIAFGDEFGAVQAENSQIKVINTITRPGPGWTGLTGRINEDMIARYMPDYGDRVFYVSGPRKMVDDLSGLLKNMNLAEGQLKREVFLGYD